MRKILSLFIAGFAALAMSFTATVAAPAAQAADPYFQLDVFSPQCQGALGTRTVTITNITNVARQGSYEITTPFTGERKTQGYAPGQSRTFDLQVNNGGTMTFKFWRGATFSGTPSYQTTLSC